MEILTGEQMRSVDRRAIDGMGIPGLDLMEAAGRGVAEALLRHYPRLRPGALLLLCGKGNNGGDGFVAARHLAERGVRPRVVLLAGAEQVRGDARVNLEALRARGQEVREVPDESAWSEVRSLLHDPGVLVVDAILGTGVRGGARGLAARVIEDLNEAPARVVSIDLPSGLDADRAEVAGIVVRAERTFTLCRPKLPLAIGPGSRFAGAWCVLPIGIPDQAVAAEGARLEWLDAADLRGLLPAREPDSHKGTFGHLLAVAGSRGKSGAAVLVARSALRCGVGLVTVATPAGVQGAVAAQQAEVMVEPLAEDETGGVAEEATERVLGLAAERDALALGPGLGVAPGAVQLVRAVLARAARPSVVDADGLNALARDGPRALGGLRSAPHAPVLTPHPGEAGRLLGDGTAAVQRDRLGAARKLAEASSSVVVLKGHRTLIAEPEGRVAVNSTGNPGLATAGTGDALTGAVGAFLARRMPEWDAARLAVFVHGRAGDLAAEDRGQEGLIASDVIERLPEALVELRAGNGRAGAGHEGRQRT